MMIKVRRQGISYFIGLMVSLQRVFLFNVRAGESRIVYDNGDDSILV